MKVVHCITGLTSDGAQGMLLRLVADLSAHGFENIVVSLQSREAMASSFEQLGVKVYSLGIRSSSTVGQGLKALCRLLCVESPDVLQGWMYHGNAALCFARKVLPRRLPLMWNIRRGLDDLHARSWKTRSMIWLNQILSRSADSLIYCTEQSMKQHEMLGFARGCGVVIGNGFDTERYRPRANARAVIAARSGISDEDLIIGHVGRYDVAKGHGYLLEAFSRVHARYPRARLVCAGRGVDHHNADLVAQIRRLEIASAVTLLGEFSPIEDLYPAFDILCSSSIAEGFPNVVAEAMASGVPCVVTDTGASRVLVEGVGEVVQTRSSEDLARGLCSLCATSATERREYGVLARDKIRELHSMKAVSERYANLYRGMYDRDRSRAGEIDKGDMAQSVGVA